MLSWWLPESVSTYGPDIDRLFFSFYYFANAGYFPFFRTLRALLTL